MCMNKFNRTQNIKIYQRMAKIALIYKFNTIPTNNAKLLLEVVIALSEESDVGERSAFNYLHQRSHKEPVMKRVMD